MEKAMFTSCRKLMAELQFNNYIQREEAKQNKEETWIEKNGKKD